MSDHEYLCLRGLWSSKVLGRTHLVSTTGALSFHRVPDRVNAVSILASATCLPVAFGAASSSAAVVTNLDQLALTPIHNTLGRDQMPILHPASADSNP